MTGAFRRNPAIVGLAVLVAVLVAALAFEVVFTGRDGADAPPKRTAAAEAKLLPPVAQVAPEQAYPETADRPLFVPLRRPAPQAAAVTAPAFQRGQFTLQGVIVVGGARTALLREKTNGRIHRLETGKDVNGVKMLQIEAASVTIGMGDEQEVLPLTTQRAGTPGQPAAAAAAPAPALAGQGPFAPPAATGFPAPGAPTPPVAGQPGIPPRLPQGAQSLTAGSAPFPPGPQNIPANPAAPPTAAAPPGADTAAMPMTPEELLARRRARRAQQNQ